MTAWQRLGIEPTDNQREIKKGVCQTTKVNRSRYPARRIYSS